MYTILLIVFRETLEAALFVGVAAAATQGLHNRKQVLGYGIAAGLLGALLLASISNRLASALDGLGQDVAQACIMSAAWLMLAWHCISSQQHGRDASVHAKDLGRNVIDGKVGRYWLSAAVALTVLREGAETVLFVFGAQANASSAAQGTLALVAAVVAGIVLGCACSVAVFQGLKVFSVKTMFKITHVLLVLFAAAIASMLAKLALGAGWTGLMPNAVWDSSALLPVNSILGAFLNALIGYDAQPAGLQLIAYVGTIALISLLVRYDNTPTIARSAPTKDERVVDKVSNAVGFGALFVASVLVLGGMAMSSPSHAGPSDYIYSPIVEAGEKEIDYKMGG